ncbi:MAG: PIN domain-containing protein [Candidatus Hydrogenedentota bacterium]
MKQVFADTSFYVASVNASDALHERALSVSDSCGGGLLTTEYVLVELGNYLASSNRQVFVELMKIIREDAQTEIVPATSQLLEYGLRRYAKRPDKAWSLTDCISFVIMEQHQLKDVLSSDHHFEQAGFRALLSLE